MKLRKYLFILLTFIGFFISCKQYSQPVCGKFKEKEYIFSDPKLSKDTSLLIAELSSILFTDKACIDAYLTRANLYFYRDSIALAERDYKKVLTIDSLNVFALYKIGIIFQTKDEDSIAVEYFQKAIDLKTTDNVIRSYSENGVSVGDEDLGRYDVEAGYLMYEQGMSLYYLRKLDEALLRFNFCISNNHFPAECYYQRGITLWEMRQDEKACQDFIEANKRGNLKANEALKEYCNVSK